MINWLLHLVKKKPHICDFKVVQTFGGIYYQDTYYRCKCNKSAVLIHGFKFTVLDEYNDHPYGKQIKKTKSTKLNNFFFKGKINFKSLWNINFFNAFGNFRKKVINFYIATL